MLQNLIRDIQQHDTHVTTGNLCTRYILDVLADNGEIDLAYALVTQTTYPSWGYMLACGATTVWERWEYVDSGELVLPLPGRAPARRTRIFPFYAPTLLPA